MKGYIIQIDFKVQPQVYVSLSVLCNDYGVNYSSASKGKRKFIIKNEVIIITECEIIKIKRKRK